MENMVALVLMIAVYALFLWILMKIMKMYGI